MFLSPTFAPTFVDALGMNTPKGKGGGRLSARWWLIIGFVFAGILWQVVRWMVRG